MGNTTIPAELVAINAIQGTLIADNAITAVHIAQNQVHSVQLAINSVTATQIADGTITSVKIQDGTIATADIADGQITTAKIADDAVTQAKIGTGAVVAASIANGAITSTQMAANSVSTANVQDNAISLAKMAGLARGSIIYGDSAGDPAYLAAGSNGHVLTSDGTDISWTADTDLFLASSGGTVTGNITISGGTLTATNAPSTIHRLNSTSNNTRSTLRLDSKDSSGNSVDVRMHSLGDGPRAEIFTYTNHDLGFATNNSAPQMTLKTTGRVGIGEQNPDTPLHVDKSGGGDLLTLGGGNVTEYVVFVDGNEVRQQVDPDNDEGNSLFTWFIDGSRKAMFQSHGLHLGGDQAKADLDIKQKGNDWENGILLRHDNADTGWNIHAERQDSALWFGYNADTSVALASQSASEVLCLKSSGNVGIGVNDPDTNLEVNIKNSADGNGIHITSTASNNDPTLKLSRNNGTADVYSLRPRGGTGSSNYLAIAPGATLDSGINMLQSGNVGLGGNTAPVSTLHIWGSNVADVGSNGAGINGLQLSRTSSKGENLYMYMTDGNAASSSWVGLGNVGKIESFGNNAFEIGSQQNIPVVVGQNNTQKLRIKGDITAHAKWGATYTESIYTPNGGTQTVRIFEDALGKWVAVGYFAAPAYSSIQGTWSSVRGGPTGLGQSETTQFSADWGDSYPTEVRYLSATDFSNFQETKTIDFIHGVPKGRPWKQFFNNAHRIPDGGTDVSSSYMGQVQGPVGSVKNGWECRGAYDGFGRWHNPDYTHHRMSDNTNINCADTAFTTATSNHFNWEVASDAKISVHHSNTYSGQDGITSAGFGNDDNIEAQFDDYPTDRSNFQSTSNNSTSAVYVLIKLPEMQPVGLEGGRSRDHQPGEIVQTVVYERNGDVSAAGGGSATYGYIDFTPKYGNSLLEFSVDTTTGQNGSVSSCVWYIYQGTTSSDGSIIRRTGSQVQAGYDQQTDAHPLPFAWKTFYQLNDDKRSTYRYRVKFAPSGGTYWGHTYGSSVHTYFSIKEIKQEHNAKLTTD